MIQPPAGSRVQSQGNYMSLMLSAGETAE